MKLNFNKSLRCVYKYLKCFAFVENRSSFDNLIKRKQIVYVNEFSCLDLIQALKRTNLMNIRNSVQLRHRKRICTYKTVYRHIYKKSSTGRPVT